MKDEPEDPLLLQLAVEDPLLRRSGAAACDDCFVASELVALLLKL